jgi:serine/threonine-protein kinase RsbW
MRKKLGRNTRLVRSEPPPSPAGQLLLDRTFASSDEAKTETLEELLKLLQARALIASETEEVRMRLVLDEALRNAVMHGNKFDAAKQARVRLFSASDAWTVLVEDQGNGFREEDLPDPDAPENLLEEGGRGVHLIRSMMDDVSYWSNGAALLMTRKTGAKEAAP